MPTPDPYWNDKLGQRLPEKPCPKCGANVGPMPLRVEHLGIHPSCGNAQKFNLNETLMTRSFP